MPRDDRSESSLSAAPRAAIVSPTEGTLTYDELEIRVRRAATWLRDRGVGPGDVVAIAMPQELALIEILLATLRISAIALPLNDRYTPRELRHPIQHAPASLAILPDLRIQDLQDLSIPIVAASTVRAALDHQVAKDSSDVAPYDLSRELALPELSHAMLLYTSGTTGQPKGVPLTRANIRATVETLRIAWALDERDVLLNVLPQYHVHGLVVATFGALCAGATSRWFGPFDPAGVLDVLASGAVTVFMAVPTLWRRMLDAQGSFDLSGLRLATSGSAALAAATHREVRERFGVDIVERYGMTESGIVVSNPLHGERRPGSVGLPLPGVQIAIAAEDGRMCAPGEVGEVLIRAPSVFSGYHRDPEATASAFYDGWLRSGDLGAVALDGYLQLVGRRSEMVITGGFNVYPAEIEAVLLSCPGIREAAVVGIADDDLGEVPVAAIVGTVDLDEVRHWLRQELAPYKIPRILRLVDALPRNAMGKIVKSIVWSTFHTGGSVRG